MSTEILVLSSDDEEEEDQDDPSQADNSRSQHQTNKDTSELHPKDETDENLKTLVLVFGQVVDGKRVEILRKMYRNANQEV